MSIDDKESPRLQAEGLHGDDGVDGVDEKRGNAADRADMFRMGKVQEMRVSG